MLRRGLLGAISAMVIVLSVGVSAASAASAPITWGAPVAADTQPPWGNQTSLKGLSCLSTPLCVAVDAHGRVVSSTNPTGGMSDWQIAPLSGVFFLNDVSCADGPFCVAVGSDFNNDNLIATSSDPTGGSSAWHVAPISVPDAIEGVSCASSSFCALVDNAGSVWTSSTPGSAASWTSTAIDGTHHLTAISCPSTSLCMATDDDGNAIYTTDPTDPTPTWTTTDVDGTNVLTDVSCVTSGECWITDGQGNVLHSNGATYSSGWTSVAVGDVATTGAWARISCSATACAAFSFAGDVAGSTTATSSQSSDWTVQSVDPGHNTLPVSCVPNSCVAVDVSGNALTATDPTGTWTTPTQIDGATSLYGVACPSVSLCVAGDNAGAVVSSTAPAGGAGAWQRARVDPGNQIYGVACPSTSLCVLGDNQGKILTSSNPAGGAGAWTSPVQISSGPLVSISCPTVSFCVAADGSGGGVWTSTNPTGGAGAWSNAAIDPGNGLTSVSCPSASLCVAVDTQGNLLTSTDPTGGASAWSAPSNIDPGTALDGVSCASTALCVVVDADGNAFVSTDPTGTAGTWQPESIDSNGDGFAGVSCRPGPTCVAVDYDGRALASTNPAGGASTWSAPQAIDPTADGLDAVTCSPGLLCVAVDYLGSLMVGTPAPPSATTLPTIGGTAAVGQRLTEAHAGWTGDPVSFAYQWEDCDPSGGACAAIPGATGPTYVVQSSDVGHTVRVQETAANAGGSGAPAVSAPSAAVPAVPGLPPSASVGPKVSGAAIVGHRLHASPGAWAGTGPISYAYQWQACRRACTNLAGATGSSYLVRKRDVGARVRVKVAATNAFGAASAVSAGDGPVVTVKQIRTTLLRASVPHGKAARYATILAHRGFTVAFTGLVPGKLHVVWKSGKVVVASGTLRFTHGSRHRLHLRLTSAGRRRLRAHAGRLVANITFTPSGARALTFSKRFSLRA